MPMVKCECGWRGNARFLPVHQKTCKRRLRILKGIYNQRVTQTLDYRIEQLSKFDIDTRDYDIEKMPDLVFNDLIFRLDALNKEKEEKESILKAKLETEKGIEEKEKAKKDELDKKEKERLEKEEKERLAQSQRVLEKEKEINNKKEIREKVFIEQRERQKATIKTENQIIKESIDNINSLVNNSLESIPKKLIDESNIPVSDIKKKKGRSKK
jgi:hypothetical protein